MTCQSTIRRQSFQVGHGARIHRASGMDSRRLSPGTGRRSRTDRAASMAARIITGAARCKPVATGSGQPAAPLAAIIPMVRSRASQRSHHTGNPIQVSTMSSSTVPIRPPSIPTGTSRGRGTWWTLARWVTEVYEPAAP